MSDFSQYAPDGAVAQSTPTLGAQFDQAELELMAEALLAYSASQRLRGLDTGACLHLDDLARRLRETGRERPVMRDDLSSALDETCRVLSERHGRAAVLRIAPSVMVVIGLLDDIEREWITVREYGEVIVTEKSTANEMVLARDVLGRVREAGDDA